MAEQQYDDNFFKDVANKHPLYNKNFLRWQLNRIVCAGSDEVKNAGQTLLPALEKQTPTEYDAYKARANFFPGAKKTVQSIIGMVHAKEPSVTFPDKAMLEDIGADDSSIVEMSMRVNREQLIVGRVGVLADFDVIGNNKLSPYVSIYKAEDIWNWADTKVNGERRFSMVVLREDAPKNEANLFDTSKKDRLRVIWIDQAGDVCVALLTESKGSGNTASTWGVIDGVQKPTIRGKTLKAIPFWIGGSESVSSTVEESPVESIVDVNLSHYRTSADLEHGRHFTALPTYYLVADVKEVDLVVGSSSFVHVPMNATEVEIGILEYQGGGLTSLEKADEQKKHEMAVLGARMLQTEKKQAEAAETVRMRQAAENSVVSTLARVSSTIFTKVLLTIAEWVGASTTDVKFEHATDFLTLTLDPKMVDSLAALVASERMSLETFYYNLHQGGFYADGTTFKAEMDNINKNRDTGTKDKDKPPMVLDDKDDVDVQ